MNIKKIFFILLVMAIFCSLLIGPNVLASKFSEGLSGTASKVEAYKTATTFPDLLANIVKALLSLVGVIFVVLLIYGGYNYLTAAGSDEKIKKGKSIIKQSVIGLVIIFFAYGIASFITTQLESPGTPPGGSGPAAAPFKPECQDPTNTSMYYSYNCCINRYQIASQVDIGCCTMIQDYYNAHRTDCGTNMP